MKKIFTILGLALSTAAFSQTVAPGISVSPTGTDGSQAITVTVNLADVCIPAGKDMDNTWPSIAFHSGGIVAGAAWTNVVEFNNANTVAFTRVSDGIFSATFTPDTYYGVDVEGFSFVFNGYPNTTGEWDSEAKAFDTEGNCTDFLYYFSDEAVSINEKALVNVVAFPNPATDVVNFQVDAADYVITLTDLTGKTVATSTTSTIEMSGLSSGAYLYKVVTNNGTATGKVTKK